MKSVFSYFIILCPSVGSTLKTISVLSCEVILHKALRVCGSEPTTIVRQSKVSNAGENTLIKCCCEKAWVIRRSFDIVNLPGVCKNPFFTELWSFVFRLFYPKDVDFIIVVESHCPNDKLDVFRITFNGVHRTSLFFVCSLMVCIDDNNEES